MNLLVFKSYCPILSTKSPVDRVPVREFLWATELVTRYYGISHKPPEKEQNIQKRQNAIRGFAKYLVSCGYPDIYTGQDDSRVFKRDFIPYIFTKEEIQRMFHLLYKRCEESPEYENNTFRIAMLLYYCCGFRRSEVLNLRVQDLDFQTDRICILHGKSDVSRMVVASDTLLSELNVYRDKYLLSAGPDEYFLHGPKSKRYCETVLYSRFHQLRADAGIMPRKDSGRQRPHDVHHTSCVRALEQIQEKGFDLCTHRCHCCRGIWGISTSRKQSIICGCWKNILAEYLASLHSAIRGFSPNMKAVMLMNKNIFSYHLTKYFVEYLPKQAAASPNTIRSYRDTFVQLMEFYKTEYRLPPEKLEYKEFTADRIECFFAYLEETRCVGICTRNQRLAAIHAFFKYLQYRDPAGFEQCTQVLSVPFKKAPVKPISIPDQKEDSQLRDLSIMALLYETGARVQELIDLCPADIRFSTTVVARLHGKGNKTKLVPINVDAAAIVRNYILRCNRTNADEPLFVNRKDEKLTRAGIQYIIDKYVSTAHVQRPDLFRSRITSHCFRHSKSMHLLEASVNLIYIRDLPGHTSVVTTEIYAKTNPKIKEAWHLSRDSPEI